MTEPQKMRRCIFASTPGGEGPFYCGHTDDAKALAEGIKHIVVGELDEMFYRDDSPRQVLFEVRLMTDREIENIPEV